MQKRKLGKSDLELSAIGFGAWAVGGKWAFGWGPQDDNDSICAIHRALDLGVNWIDTAAVYGLGHSEEVVARALADRKGKVLIATKCGLRWRQNGLIYGSLKSQSIRDEVEASLRRLQVETIDLYQIHWPNPNKNIEEGWGVMADLVKEGKIRYAGVSNFDVAQMQRAQQIFPITSLQPPYSILNREVEKEILPYCQDNDMGVIGYSPMQAGLLTGSFSHQRLETLPSDDWRRRDRFFQEPAFSRALEIVEKLRPIAMRENHTLAQLAIAWVLRRSEITAAIVGARHPNQIEETVQASDWSLSEQTITEIEQCLNNAYLN
jgi:aryl-alcohol dehydrogenase-like predicted oxidoreductase